MLSFSTLMRGSPERSRSHTALAKGRAAPPANPRILIVDDEPTVLRAYRRLLETSYTVVAAQSATAALEQIACDAHFDLILCDVGMPGLDGVELYENITAQHPELASKIVFCSGGALGWRVEEFLAKTRCRILYKPLAAATLQKTVAAVVKQNSA